MNDHKAPLSIIAGGAGFIGVAVVEQLLGRGHSVAVIDNFVRGRRSYLDRFLASSGRLLIIEADLSQPEECANAFTRCKAFGDATEVWHLAANSDIPAGVADSRVDLKDTFLTTHEILRCMQRQAIGVLNFASSSAVYGDFGSVPLTETLGPLLPISNYGAMKLASEALVSAAGEAFLKRANLFRFPNVVGTPATHGVILDFILKLQRDPTRLDVLGDGTQQKAYLHVQDLVQAMLVVRDSTGLPPVEVVNIGPVDEGVTVRWIAEQVVRRVSPQAQIVFGQGNKGWLGDVPRFNYSTQRIRSHGWQPVLGSQQAVLRAIDEVATERGF